MLRVMSGAMWTLLLVVTAVARLSAQSINEPAPGQTEAPSAVDAPSLAGGMADSSNVGPFHEPLFLQDSLRYNMYGDLLDDDPVYNEKSSIPMVALRVTLSNLATWAIDHYIFDYEFVRVGPETWKHNFVTGWEWDVDGFSMNHFFHPYSGGMFFNAARANGMNFEESIPFAILGSLEWEYFAENTLPSYNDLINTPVNGVFFGEILYRLGSNILDDQSTGWERILRELAVGFITPTRFFSRLASGKLFETRDREVYQKEPMNITLSGGYHRVNEGRSYEDGTNSVNINVHLDYGNPFEMRARKPYDYFKLRLGLDFGVGLKVIDNVIGHGILWGRNLPVANADLLLGVFQHMNFLDNNTFELATIGFGLGVISKVPLTAHSSLYTSAHLGVVPFGGLSGRYGPNDAPERDYNYSGGAEIQIVSSYDLGFLSLTFVGFYWALRSFVGVPGSSFIGLIKPRVTIQIFDNLSFGFEHQVYYSDRYPRDHGALHSVRTEQKIFVSVFLEQYKFRERK